MRPSGKASWRAALLAALGVGLAGAALGPGGLRAQLRDPPPGWDMWYPGWTRPDAWRQHGTEQGMRWRMTRHEAFIEDGVPPAYRGARNPMPMTPDSIDRGRALYVTNCAPCHDPSGMGHGDAGLALYPSPALLARLVRMPTTVDEYLLWAISEGGEPFGTAMPTFKDALSREQIWEIVTYMRAGFPADGETGAKQGG